MRVMCACFGAVARSRGMAKVARRAGLAARALQASAPWQSGTGDGVARRQGAGIDLAAKPTAARLAKPKASKPRSTKRISSPRRAA